MNALLLFIIMFSQIVLADTRPFYETNLVFAVNCGEADGKYRSLFRYQWERQGLSFSSGGTTIEDAERLFESRLRPYSHGIPSTAIREWREFRQKYKFLPDIELNKDVIKPYINDLPQDCDFLPVAADINNQKIIATDAFNKLSPLDQLLVMTPSSLLSQREYNLYRDWPENIEKLRMVGQILSDNIRVVSREEFYKVFRHLAKDNFDIIECDFNVAGFLSPQKCESVFDFNETPLVSSHEGLQHYYNVYFYTTGTIKRFSILSSDRYEWWIPVRRSQIENDLRTVNARSDLQYAYSPDGKLIFSENTIYTSSKGSYFDTQDRFQMPNFRGQDIYVTGPILRDSDGKIRSGVIKDTIKFSDRENHWHFSSRYGANAIFGSDGALKSLDVEVMSGNYLTKALAEFNTKGKLSKLDGPSYYESVLTNFTDNESIASVRTENEHFDVLLSSGITSKCSLRVVKTDHQKTIYVQPGCSHVLRFWRSK